MFNKITIITQDLENNLKQLPDNTMVGIFSRHTHLTPVIAGQPIKPQFVEDILDVIFKDDRIGFVYTDLVIIQNGIKSIEYLKGLDVQEVPFFAKVLPFMKQNNFKIDPQRPYSSLMTHFASRGYMFEHFAEPLLTITQ